MSEKSKTVHFQKIDKNRAECGLSGGNILNGPGGSAPWRARSRWWRPPLS